MSMRSLGVGTAALALLAAAGASTPADARHSGHGGHGMVAHFAGPNHFAGHRFHHRRFIFIGAYPYDYGYGYGCGWLRRRALHTGSPYWWHRYEACLSGSY
jgi:hypothetical protein